MNIGKKKWDNKPVQQRVVNLTESQKKLWMEIPGVQIPVGKYKGRLLADIRREEEWYYKWAWDNEMLWSWSLMVLKSEAMRPKTSKPKGFYSDRDRAYWLGLREVI